MTKVINTQRVTHSLPKSLATNREHMQNLAEMLYAMTSPGQWAENLATNNGYKTLKYFRDFNYEKLFPYNDDSFFNEVAYYWEQKGLFQTLFGLTRAQMKSELEQGGLKLVYSSATMSGNKIQMPIATYYNTNLKTEALSKSNSEWTTAFNIQQLMNPGYITYSDISGQRKAWLVRYATGATLCKGSQEAAAFNKYGRLTNCEDVFVYNRDVLNLTMTANALSGTEPMKTVNDATKWNLGDYSGYAFYEHGDILLDENGHHWIVINQAGNPDSQEDIGEKMPFAELVCFEGFDISANRKDVTNLPSHDEAIRGAFRLDMFFTQTGGIFGLKKADKPQWIKDGKYPLWGSSLYNALEFLNVEMRDLFQLIYAQNGDPRQSSHAASIAYSDGTGRLRLMRFIVNNQNVKQDFHFYLWDHYVASPDATTQLYPSYAYDMKSPIYLDNLTDSMYIKLYDTLQPQDRPGRRVDGHRGVGRRREHPARLRLAQEGHRPRHAEDCHTGEPHPAGAPCQPCHPLPQGRVEKHHRGPRPETH